MDKQMNNNATPENNPKDSGDATTPESQHPAVDENTTTPSKQQGEVARQQSAANFPGLLGATRRRPRHSGSTNIPVGARQLPNPPVPARQALPQGNPPVPPRPVLGPSNAPQPGRRLPAGRNAPGPVQLSRVMGNAPVRARRALQFGVTPLPARRLLLPPNAPRLVRRPPAHVRARRALPFNNSTLPTQQNTAPANTIRQFLQATAFRNALARLSNRPTGSVVMFRGSVYLISNDGRRLFPFGDPRTTRPVRNNGWGPNGPTRRDLFGSRGQPIIFHDDDDSSDIGWVLPVPLCMKNTTEMNRVKTKTSEGKRRRTTGDTSVNKDVFESTKGSRRDDDDDDDDDDDGSSVGERIQRRPYSI